VQTDTDVEFSELRVDGGMVENELLLQFQADILGIDVVRPQIAKTTALGAAYAAGLAVGFWTNLSDVVQNWQEDRRWHPQMRAAEQADRYRTWQKAVEKSLGWVE